MDSSAYYNVGNIKQDDLEILDYNQHLMDIMNTLEFHQMNLQVSQYS